MWSLSLVFTTALFAVLTLAAPFSQAPDLTSADIGLSLVSGSGSLPYLVLPYGIWQASSYDSINDVRPLLILSNC